MIYAYTQFNTGLKPGDKWYLCQDRWNEAFNNGIKTKVIKMPLIV